MSSAVIKVLLKLATDKRFWKAVGAIFVILALIVSAAGTSCTAHNLQSYSDEKVSTYFAPYVATVEAEMEDGDSLNTSLMYASYITFFDNPRYPDKEGVCAQLIHSFYYEFMKKVEVKDAKGNPVLDKKGNKTYTTKKVAKPYTDNNQIFSNIASSFGISISDQQKLYTISLSQMLTGIGSTTSLSDKVSAYEPLVSQYCTQYGISQYTALVMAIMQLESGGTGTDPMQCSESPLNTKYSHQPGSIKDPKYSIQIGIEYFASCLKAAKCKSPNDIPGISLALQGYNFGNGYISWALERGGYSRENAAEFSQMEAAKMGWKGYGDVNYVSDVLRYYNALGGGNSSGMFSYPINAGQYTVTSGFESRADPFSGKTTFHNGIDFAAPEGTQIHAAANGTVTYAQFGSAPYGGYGNIVVIQHSSSLISMYGHCSKLLVSKGQTVQKGQVIALVGSTGESTGNHCHFEVRVNNKSVNPKLYLK